MPDLLETIEDGVATLTLNRPEALNALSMEIRHGLLEALDRLGKDDSVGCIVLTGAGRGFCAGGDVKSMADRSAAGFEARAAGIQF
ncbi:MAG: enoyl-CoA hydratase/isomerase family protein, partial [Rhodospirillales bacterium]|nr:enoyl-CoA hydratase/isomerase family protein [Rhodospirillales bacterium]